MSPVAPPTRSAPARAAPAPLHTIPICRRPRPTLAQRLHLVLFNLSFLTLCLVLHAFQLLSVPFRPLQRLAKEAFGSVLVALVALFGPSTLVVTVQEGEECSLDEVVSKDPSGRVVGLRLDRHAVLVSNHQMYADWIYPWIAMSYAGVANGLVIVLKASLEWAPLVGPAMQLFRFCFINSTTKPLDKSNLVPVAREAQRRGEAYQCLLFPEGTLYSSLTRPKSKLYADKVGIPDTTHVLLPRSLGLFHTLTALSLSPSAPFPNLTLYDLTLAYPGVPAQGYAQDYYRLQTLFGLRVPPPTVHLHVRRVRKVATAEDGPLAAAAPPRGSREEFDAWLGARWREKDALMGHFGDRGTFEGGPGVARGRAELPIRLRAGDALKIGTVCAAVALGAWGVWAVWGLWRGGW
ncbi:hypothetical protein DMC30DRAFT_447498 [Rhodotorula diobovata]|uniref:Phospholipid/glycerol acyltransferase domain-containing protein n=1 Tax=Rhodotorula diobovata TaxID=5288 RepID=A0A5C5FT36_9BASI|nr:hypothetical protein DMC30DRAFT_447498 [Rhodotorula diobovata]